MFEFIMGVFVLIIALIVIWAIKHAVTSGNGKSYEYKMEDGVDTVKTKE